MAELDALLQKITLSPFSRKHKDRGELIFDILQKLGGSPYFDEYGNLRAQKGKGVKRILIDAHIDTVFRHLEDYCYDNQDGIITGCLDNSVGCAIAIQLFEILEADAEFNFVFSIDEEIGGYGASHIVHTEEREFDFCVVFDVTFPENNTQVYCENFSSKKFMAEFENNNLPEGVQTRKFNFPDSGTVYGRRWNSVSICPVVFDNMHSPHCWTKIEHIEKTVDFLKNLFS